MTRALLDLYGMPAAVAEFVAAEYGSEVTYGPDTSPVVILEPAGRGTCDRCQRGPVPLFDVGPMDEGAWQECEPCIRRAAARRGAR